MKYVSRGGIKLEHALEAFSINPQQKVCCDVGCSTGGFSDCLLQHGAKKVYAVDVGYGQFDWKLRNDPRVVLIERQNFRHLDREAIPEALDLAVIDVAFISLKKIFPPLKKFLASRGEVIALIKPQFEVERKEVGKKGVVKEPVLHERVLREIREAGEREGWVCQGTTPSPLLGPEGNREFFIVFQTENLVLCGKSPSLEGRGEGGG